MSFLGNLLTIYADSLGVPLRTIGRNIRLIRKQKGLTQQDLAAKIGRSRQQVSNYEKGDCKDLLSMGNMLEALATALNCTTRDLCTGLETRLDRRTLA